MNCATLFVAIRFIAKTKASSDFNKYDDHKNQKKLAKQTGQIE